MTTASIAHCAASANSVVADANQPIPSGLKARGIVTILFVLAAVIVLERLHTYSEPLERDITTYAVIAHQVLEGKLLYTELFDHKPPAVHTTYAVAELIAGYGRNSIFLMNVVAALTTMLACYFAGSALSQKPVVGLFAAAIWAITCGELGLEANQPNTEVFINAFLTTGFAIFLRNLNGSSTRRMALLVGLLFGIASLYKQIAALPVALLCLAHVASVERSLRRRAIIDVVYIATVGACLWALVFEYFTAQGRSDSFIGATFIYNQSYAGDLLANLAGNQSRIPLPFESSMILRSLGALAIVGAGCAMIFTKVRRPWMLLFAYSVGIHIAVLLPGQFFAHYYQLWLPVLAIGAAWTLSLLSEIRTSSARWLRYATPVFLLLALLLVELPYYFLSPEMWSVRKYGPIFVEAEKVAHRVDAILEPDETFYEWGSETNLYFEIKRDPPSGVFFADPLLTGPLRGELWHRVVEDFERRKPDVIVLERSAIKRTPQMHPILDWVKHDYRAISKGGMFLLMGRKGSRVEKDYVASNERPRA